MTSAPVAAAARVREQAGADPGVREQHGDDGERHAWERGFGRWDGFFALVWVATASFGCAAQAREWPVRAVAVGLFVLLVPWYTAVGRPLILGAGGGRVSAGQYVAVLIAVFTVAGSLVGELRLGTTVLVPLCFMLLRARAALAAVAVVNLAPVAGWAVLWRPGAQLVAGNAVFAVVTLALSAVLGSWVMHIITQSAERAEMLAEVRAGREEIARLSAERGALAERERLSREIHDTLAQGFTSLLMLVQAVESELDRDTVAARRHLELMARTARQNLAEARALVAGGAPADLADASLPDAVRRLAARHAEQSGAAAAVEITGAVRALPPPVEVVALRACQEALANVRRHAGPDAAVTLRLAYEDAELTVTVRDEGCGFAAPAVAGPATAAGPAASGASGGYGLRGLRGRAGELGGEVRVAGAPGEGTTVCVRLPAAEREAS